MLSSSYDFGDVLELVELRFKKLIAVRVKSSLVRRLQKSKGRFLKRKRLFGTDTSEIKKDDF